MATNIEKFVDELEALCELYGFEEPCTDDGEVYSIRVVPLPVFVPPPAPPPNMAEIARVDASQASFEAGRG